MLRKMIVTVLVLPGIVFADSKNIFPSGAWNQHQGAYVGTMIGFNLNCINFYGLNARFHTVTHNLLGGYLFQPNYGLEMEVGSYFSGLGLAVRGSAKGIVPVGKNMNLFGDAGAAYISTFLEKGFVGPYVDAGASFALSKKLAWTASVSDVISSYSLGATNNVSTNFITFVTGFNYYVS